MTAEESNSDRPYGDQTSGAFVNVSTCLAGTAASAHDERTEFQEFES